MISIQFKNCVFFDLDCHIIHQIVSLWMSLKISYGGKDYRWNSKNKIKKCEKAASQIIYKLFMFTTFFQIHVLVKLYIKIASLHHA